MSASAFGLPALETLDLSRNSMPTIGFFVVPVVEFKALFKIVQSFYRLIVLKINLVFKKGLIAFHFSKKMLSLSKCGSFSQRVRFQNVKSFKNVKGFVSVFSFFRKTVNNHL